MVGYTEVGHRVADHARLVVQHSVLAVRTRSRHWPRNRQIGKWPHTGPSLWEIDDERDSPGRSGTLLQSRLILQRGPNFSVESRCRDRDPQAESDLAVCREAR
jgi:hypothetical protein